MDSDYLINNELHRQKHNNTQLLREEEEHRLIAEGEGKLLLKFIDEDTLISYLQDQGRQRQRPWKMQVSLL